MAEEQSFPLEAWYLWMANEGGREELEKLWNGLTGRAKNDERYKFRTMLKKPPKYWNGLHIDLDWNELSDEDRAVNLRDHSFYMKSRGDRRMPSGWIDASVGRTEFAFHTATLEEQNAMIDQFIQEKVAAKVLSSNATNIAVPKPVSSRQRNLLSKIETWFKLLEEINSAFSKHEQADGIDQFLFGGYVTRRKRPELTGGRPSMDKSLLKLDKVALRAAGPDYRRTSWAARQLERVTDIRKIESSEQIRAQTLQKVDVTTHLLDDKDGETAREHGAAIKKGRKRFNPSEENEDFTNVTEKLPSAGQLIGLSQPAGDPTSIWQMDD